MKRMAYGLVVGCILLLLASPAAAQKPGDIIPGRYLVTFQAEVTAPELAAQQLSRAHGFMVRHIYQFAIRGMAIEVPAGAELGILSALRRDPRVATIGHDRYIAAFAETLPKGINRINAEPGVGANTATGVDVAVIDTGLDFPHLDLAGNIDTARSVNCIGVGCVAGGQDDNGHGTFVGGILAAIHNNIDVVGVGHQAKLISVKVLKSDGSGSFTDVIAGLNYVTGLAQSANPVEVANMSLGATCNVCTDNSTDPTIAAFHNAVRALVNAGTTVVVAAGNDGVNAANTVPASFDEVITVSAMADSDGKPGGLGPPVCFFWLLACFAAFPDDSFALDPVWGFSNFGPDIDVIAPGVQETSLNLGGGVSCPPDALNCGSGTSFSSPHAAGVAAIFIRDRLNKGQPTPLPGTVRQALIQTGECHEGAGTIFYGTAGCSTVWPGDPDGIGEPLVRADNVVNFSSPAVFDVAVTSISATSPVLISSNNSVSVGVANQGTQSETFTVSLSDSLAATINNSQTVTLAAGASNTLTFSWQPTVTGSHVLTATAGPVGGETNTANNSKSTTVTVNQITHDVAVLSISAPASVPQGETATVSVNVANQGTVDETFTVSLSDTPPSGGTAGTVSPAQNVTLLAGASTTVNFTWNTTGASTGDHTLNATASSVPGETNTANNSKNTLVSVVVPRHDVAVTSIISQSVVTKPDSLGILVNVANQGTFTETFTVSANDTPPSGGTPGTWSPAASQTVSNLAPGASTSLVFVWDTTGASTGNHTLTFTAGLATDQDLTNNSKSTIVTVSDLTHDVAVNSVTAPASVTEGQNATVSVGIANVGTAQMTVTVTLSDFPPTGGIAGTVSAPQTVTLAPGASTTLNFTWFTSGASSGTHALSAIAGPVQNDTNPFNNTGSTTSTVLLAAPSNLTATAGSIGGKRFVDLAWVDNSTDEDGFIIERCLVGKGGSCTFQQLATVGANVTTYRDSSVSGQKTYRYRVKAHKAGFPDSGYSNVAQVKTP